MKVLIAHGEPLVQIGLEGAHAGGLQDVEGEVAQEVDFVRRFDAKAISEAIAEEGTALSGSLDDQILLR